MLEYINLFLIRTQFHGTMCVFQVCIFLFISKSMHCEYSYLVMFSLGGLVPWLNAGEMFVRISVEFGSCHYQCLTSFSNQVVNGVCFYLYYLCGDLPVCWRRVAALGMCRIGELNSVRPMADYNSVLYRKVTMFLTTAVGTCIVCQTGSGVDAVIYCSHVFVILDRVHYWWRWQTLHNALARTFSDHWSPYAYRGGHYIASLLSHWIMSCFDPCMTNVSWPQTQAPIAIATLIQAVANCVLHL